MSYANIIDFGPSVENEPNNNPLAYCMTTDLNNSFIHTAGKKRGPYSKSCQMFMSDYCAANWDGACEYASANTNSNYPNTISQCNVNTQGACLGTGLGSQFTHGDMLVRNTAAKKYLSKISSSCCRKYEPFDPQVPTSPMISYFESDCRSKCIPIYEVDPKTIDNDPVMNKILYNPLIAIDILINIYNSAKRLGKLDELKDTKLYRFFITAPFQQYVKNSQKRAEAMVNQK